MHLNIFIWLRTKKCMTFMWHFYNSGINLQSFGRPSVPERGREVALGHLLCGTCLSLCSSLSVSPSLSISLSYSCLYSLFFFLVCSLSFFFFLVLSSSPTHTFRDITEHHNNSCQVPVCTMIYSRFPVMFGFH